jgi:hypothetical protein
MLHSRMRNILWQLHIHVSPSLQSPPLRSIEVAIRGYEFRAHSSSVTVWVRRLKTHIRHGYVSSYASRVLSSRWSAMTNGLEIGTLCDAANLQLSAKWCSLGQLSAVPQDALQIASLCGDSGSRRLHHACCHEQSAVVRTISLAFEWTLLQLRRLHWVSQVQPPHHQQLSTPISPDTTAPLVPLLLAQVRHQANRTLRAHSCSLVH